MTNSEITNKHIEAAREIFQNTEGNRIDTHSASFEKFIVNLERHDKEVRLQSPTNLETNTFKGILKSIASLFTMVPVACATAALTVTGAGIASIWDLSAMHIKKNYGKKGSSHRVIHDPAAKATVDFFSSLISKTWDVTTSPFSEAVVGATTSFEKAYNKDREILGNLLSNVLQQSSFFQKWEPSNSAYSKPELIASTKRFPYEFINGFSSVFLEQQHLQPSTITQPTPPPMPLGNSPTPSAPPLYP